MDELQPDDGLSESWPKEFSELRELEKLLRCNICKDFMKTAMITGCSHLFCSYCIRQSIQYRNQCPACFVELFDNQLRPERTLDEVLRIFTSVKRKLLKRLQISYAACPATDDVDSQPPATPCVVNQEQKDKLQDQVKPSSVLLFNSPLKCPESPSVVKHRTVPDMFSPRPKLVKTDLCSPKGLNFSTSSSSQAVNPSSSGVTKREPGVNPSSSGVTKREPGVNPSSSGGTKREPDVKTESSAVPCPVCSVEIPNKHINLHLDECLARASGAPPKSQPQNKPSRKPLPKLVLTLMKEKELKSYCREYGLNTIGDRKTLITRIQRYTTLYNSECDSLNPRSKQEIIRQVEKEEKSITSSSNVKPLFSQVTRKTDPKIIEEVNTKYLQENKSAFQKLIENMRERDGANIKRSPRPTVTKIVSDDEEEDLKPGPSDCKASAIETDRRIRSDDEDVETDTCFKEPDNAPIDRRILSDDEDSKPRSSVCETSPAADSVLTPKSRYRKLEVDADRGSTSSSTQMKNHAPPLCPEIRISSSPSLNPANSPTSVNSTSPRHHIDCISPLLDGPERRSLTSSTPIVDSSHKSSENTLKLGNKFRASLKKNVDRSSKKPSTLNSSFKNPNNISKRSIDIVNSSRAFLNKDDQFKEIQNSSKEGQSLDDYFFSNLSPPSSYLSSPTSSRTQCNVHSRPTTSSGVEEKRASQSPDLFLADVTEDLESTPPGRMQCGSPDMLGNFNSSLTPLSQKSHLSQGGHFLFSDSDSDAEPKKVQNNTTVTNNKEEGALPNDSSRDEKKSPDLWHILGKTENSDESATNQNRASGSKVTSQCQGNVDALINGDSEDEDFLQLLQNRRGKRKPKQVVMSPRTTRSKRRKS